MTNNISFQNDPSSLLRYRDSIYASDLLVCAIVYLDVFTRLIDGPLGLEELCDALQTEERPTDVMLSLLLAMKLLKKDGTVYGLTSTSKEFLVKDSPKTLIPYYSSLKNRPQCKEFLDVLKTGKAAGWSSDGSGWIEAMREEGFADSFTVAMDSRGMYLARKLVEKIDLSRRSSLLDVAGGSGIYASSMVQRFPHLNAAVLEIPPVDQAAKRSIRSKGMADRVNVISGDMFREIPSGYDTHLFANTFHDWSMDSVRRLIGNSFAALPPQGSIVVFDSHLNKEKSGPLAVAEYSCLLMHSTEGRCYSADEITDLLLDAGFRRIDITDVAAGRSVITGHK